jgi:hypothetical protein
MAVKLQVRRGTTSEWSSTNPTLAAGEIAWDSTSNQFKVGDGVRLWSQIDYVSGPIGATGAGVASGGSVNDILIKTGTDPYVTGWTSNYVRSINGASGVITGLATLASPTFTGTVGLPANTSLTNPSLSGATLTGTLTATSAIIALGTGGSITANSATITAAQLSYVSGVTSSIQTQLGTKAPTASPQFTGVVNLSSSSVLLGSGYASKYLTADVSGNLAVGAAASGSASINTLALRDGSGNLYASSFSGSSLQLTGSGFSATIFPTSGIIGANHAFYLPQLTSPYTATLITSADSKTVSNNMLADNSVTEAKIADNSVTSNKIVNGAIVNEDISATANIAVSKLSASSVTINGVTATLGGSAVTVTAVPNDASVTDAKIVSGGLSPSKITGTAIVEGDGRLTNTRTPTAGTVVDASIVSGGLSPSKITGTAAVTGSANTFAVSSNVTPITIKGQGSGTPVNLQEWWFNSLETSARAWVDGYGTLVSKVGINAGLVPPPITGVTLGILTVQPDGENSGKGLVIRRSGLGNVFEVQEASSGSGILLMDYQGAIYSPGSDKTALVVGDARKTSVQVTLTSSSYDLNSQLFTFNSNTSTGLFNGTRITFSNFTGDYAVLNGATFTMTYSGSGLAFTVPYASDTGFTTGTLGVNGATATGSISGQTVDIQRWRTVDSPNVSGVDYSGLLYSTRLYTKFVPTLAIATNSGNTIPAGFLGYASTSADLVARSIGVYDTTGKNQIFGNTTVGFSTSTVSGVANTVSAGITQYGALQAYKQVAGTGVNAVLVARATSGTGNLQQWQYGTSGTIIAKLDYQGNLSLGYGNVSGTGNATGNGTTGYIMAPGGISLDPNFSPPVNGRLNAKVGAFSESVSVSSSFSVSNALSALVDTTNSNANKVNITGKLTITGNTLSKSVTIDAAPEITFPQGSYPNGLTGTPFVNGVSIVNGPDNYNLANATRFSVSGIYKVYPRGSFLRLYTCNSLGTILSKDDWIEVIVNDYDSLENAIYDNNNTVTGFYKKGPAAGANFVASTNSDGTPTTTSTTVKLVPIGVYSDSEIRTTDTVRVGAEGTVLKRTWGGIANSTTIPTWSSGTYSAGSLVSYVSAVGLSNTSTVYQRTSTTGTSTVAPPADPTKWTPYVNYSISYQGSNVWMLTYIGPVAPSSVHLNAMDSTRDIVCTLTEAPSISSGTVSIKFRARDIVNNMYITADPLKIYWMAIE